MAPKPQNSAKSAPTYFGLNPAKPVLQRLARQLRRRGWTDTAIAAELGIERHTVAVYIGRRRSGPWSRKRKATVSGAQPVEQDNSAAVLDGETAETLKPG